MSLKVGMGVVGWEVGSFCVAGVFAEGLDAAWFARLLRSR